MSDLLDTFQQRHQENLNQLKREDVDEVLLDEIQALINDLRQAGDVTTDPADRGQLRALTRFWGSVVYDHTGVYPDITLLPLDTTRARPPDEPTRRPLPSLGWVLIGGAAVITIAVGLFIIRWISAPYEITGANPTPTAMPIVRHSALERGPGGETGGLETAAGTFCLGTPEVTANFALEYVQPRTRLHWELWREGEVVSAQPAAPWGEENQYVTVRIVTSGPNSVEPGQYDLFLYADEQVVSVQSFHLLGTAARVSNLQVADVPSPDDVTSGERVFEPGVRVIYLSYEHAGLCTGLDLSHTIYYEGEPILQREETWLAAPQGQKQVSFQASDSLALTPGDYEIAVAVAGKEQARTAFTIRAELVEEEEEEPEPEPEPVPPAFGDITLTQGVHADGTPILTAPNDRFDWNTRVVYAIFDTAGMTKGLAWTAVWRRQGVEEARWEYFWHEEVTGTVGTHWVAYHREDGRVLPGGSYSVTLYIDDVEQRTADFAILYYNP